MMTDFHWGNWHMLVMLDDADACMLIQPTGFNPIKTLSPALFQTSLQEKVNRFWHCAWKKMLFRKNIHLLIFVLKETAVLKKSHHACSDKTQSVWLHWHEELLHTQQGLRGRVDRLCSNFAWSGTDFGLFQSLTAKDNLMMLTGMLANMWLGCLS